MAEPKSSLELLAVSVEALKRNEAVASLAGEDARPPALGDIYVLNELRDGEHAQSEMRDPGIEWVLIGRDPADPERFLAVPADGNFLAGSADYELPADSPAGALTLRCRFATWIDRRLLKPEYRVGGLARSDVAGARQKWLEVGDGEMTGSVLAREVDDDPEYQDWLEEVLVPARDAVLGVVGGGTTAAAEQRAERPAVRSRRSQGAMFFRIAASLIVAVASVQLWRLSERIQDLETASRGADERHGAAVRQFETERDRLTAERDSLLVRQQELEAAGAQSEQQSRELRERVADLDRRLGEAERASEVVNPALAFFRPPEETQRGRVEVTLRPEQSYVVLFLPLGESAPASRYRLEVRMKGVEAPIWTNDRLIVQEPGDIRVGLPAKMLAQGEYVLELSALGDSRPSRIAEYELVVFVE